MELKKLKIKKLTELSYMKVHDISVKDVEHYILDDGIISHNSGAIYNASIILEFAKAGLKENDKEAAEQGQQKSGIVVTSKVVKNRFARPLPIKFHISFYKGMNPYVGLENYVSWETCGIERGKLIEEIIEEPVFEDDGVTPVIYRGKPKVNKVNTGKMIFEPDPKGKKFAVKHLGKEVKNIFTSEVFTDEVLQQLDDVIRPIFELPKTMTTDFDELEEAMGFDDDDDDVDEMDERFIQDEA
jgi:hypothetical protein